MIKVRQPTLLADEAKCRRHIRYMAETIRNSRRRFRPHFKTHQSATIGEWFRDEGVDAITVSSVRMAEYFADHGWRDITIAFPVNWREIHVINNLSARCRLNLLVTSPEAAAFLSENIQQETGVLIEIDAGYPRSGIDSDDSAEIESVIATLRSNRQTVWKGFLSHFGNTYSARGREEIMAIYNYSIKKLAALKERYRADYPDIMITVGDTPSCSVVTDFADADELRPGNFVFYDLMQAHIGSCGYDDIAVAMACPVVDKRASRSELIISGGAVHLSKDSLMIDGKPVYGELVLPEQDGWRWPAAHGYVRALSQEHGIIPVTDAVYRQVSIGDVIGVIPVHACLAVSAMRSLMTLEGKFIECMRN